MNKLDDLVRRGKLKKISISKDMYEKEFSIAGKDLDSAKNSYDFQNYKWATIQAYYAIFHAVRALVFKSGYREESHTALKTALKELYISSEVLPISIYNAFERGMDLREMADYKETYSQNGAESLIKSVDEAIKLIELEVKR